MVATYNNPNPTVNKPTTGFNPAAAAQIADPTLLNQEEIGQRIKTQEGLFGGQLAKLRQQYGALNSAAGAGAAASRAAVGAQQGQLQYNLKSGLRDIQIAEREGMQGAVSNALGRGIYDSGIRKEGQLEVKEAAINAEDDLRANVRFGMAQLQASLASIAANLAQGQAGNAIGLSQTSFQLNQQHMQNLIGYLEQQMLAPTQQEQVDAQVSLSQGGYAGRGMVAN